MILVPRGAVSEKSPLLGCSTNPKRVFDVPRSTETGSKRVGWSSELEETAETVVATLEAPAVVDLRSTSHHTAWCCLPVWQYGYPATKGNNSTCFCILLYSCRTITVVSFVSSTYGRLLHSQTSVEYPGKPTLAVSPRRRKGFRRGGRVGGGRAFRV